MCLFYVAFYLRDMELLYKVLPLTVSCFSKVQIGFTFLVPAHPGSPGKRAAIKRVCMYVSKYRVALKSCTFFNTPYLWNSLR